MRIYCHSELVVGTNESFGRCSVCLSSRTTASHFLVCIPFYTCPSGVFLPRLYEVLADELVEFLAAV